MIHFRIGRERHTVKDHWKDLTLSEAMTLRAIDLPEVEDTFDWYMHLQSLYAVARLMTTVNPEQVPPHWLVHWHTKYWLPMWADLRSEFPTTYTPQGIEQFEHRGVVYHMPERLELGEDIVLQHGQDAKRFVEASNLLATYSRMVHDGIKAAPLFIATVVRVEGEGDMDERVVAERARRFETLPMPIVWEVFFCTSQHLLRQMTDTLPYLVEVENPTSRPTSGNGYLPLRIRGLVARWQRWVGCDYGSFLRR